MLEVLNKTCLLIINEAKIHRDRKRVHDRSLKLNPSYSITVNDRCLLNEIRLHNRWDINEQDELLCSAYSAFIFVFQCIGEFKFSRGRCSRNFVGYRVMDALFCVYTVTDVVNEVTFCVDSVMYIYIYTCIYMYVFVCLLYIYISCF